MAHIGVFCLPMASHVNLFLAVSSELARRGHRITLFGISANEPRIRDAGFGFESTEPDDLPRGTLSQMIRQMGELGSVAALRLHGRFDQIRYEGILKKGPDLLRRAGIEALIVDQAEPSSGSLAEAAGLAWVSVASGICMNSEAAVPPLFTSWGYSDSPLAIARNRLVYAGMKIATRPIENLINRYRANWGLKPLTRMDDSFSPFAQISQQVCEFDFPRRELPGCFHYVGPIRAPGISQTDFPWSRLDGRPLIYASFGTFVNRQSHLYSVVPEACAGLEAQLVLSLGGSALSTNFPKLAGAPLVVEFAPQYEILSRAALSITHGGLNTTLESLSNGVPLVAIPIAFDQPGVAARIRWTQTGDFVTPRRLTAQRLRELIIKVLREPVYRSTAARIRQAIAGTAGLCSAADIIEKVILTKAPVFRPD